MNLNFNTDIVKNYHGSTQIARVLTENWVQENLYCPRCGNKTISHFPNNRPVADFYCPLCKNEFELKSKNGSIQRKVNDGAYETMIQRITGNQNPDFLFMSYSKEENRVRDLVLIPKHFFVPDIIEARSPLPPTARRAGWVGCNILIEKIPQQGRIDIIKNGLLIPVADVVTRVNKSDLLAVHNLSARGWLMDVLTCVNKMPSDVFSLADIYRFVPLLSSKHPQNNNIEAKIRQQLQFLRDKGYIEFLGKGVYRKLQ